MGHVTFYVDRICGAKASRPQLDQLMQDLRAGKIERLIVYKLDRLGRSLTHLALILDELNRLEVLIASSQGIDTSDDIREQAFCYFSKPFSPSSVADMITQAVNTGHWQDDIEVLSATPQWISLRLRCKMETADRLMQFVREMEMDFSEHERDNIAAAFRELLMNAIEHGGESDPSKPCRSYVRTTRAIVYLIQDPGKGFSFDAIAHAAVANPPGEPARHLEIRAEQGVRPGGFGILLTRNLVDELIYSEKGNEVLFIKYLK